MYFMCVSVHMCTHAWELEVTARCLPRHSGLYFVVGSLTASGAYKFNKKNWPARSPPSSWDYRATPPMPAFYSGAGYPGSGPNACVANTLLTEFSL